MCANVLEKNNATTSKSHVIWGIVYAFFLLCIGQLRILCEQMDFAYYY